MRIEAPIPKKNLFWGVQKKWGEGWGWGQKIRIFIFFWRGDTWGVGLLTAEDEETHVCANFSKIRAKFIFFSEKLGNIFMFLEQSDKVLQSGQGISSEWAQLSSFCSSVRHHEADGAMRIETLSLSLKGGRVWNDQSRCRLPSGQVGKSGIYIHRGRYFGKWSKYNNGIFTHRSFTSYHTYWRLSLIFADFLIWDIQKYSWVDQVTKLIMLLPITYSKHISPSPNSSPS